MCTLNIVYRIFEYAAIPVVLFRAFHSFRDDVHCSEQFVQGIVVLFFFLLPLVLLCALQTKSRRMGNKKKNMKNVQNSFGLVSFSLCFVVRFHTVFPEVKSLIFLRLSILWFIFACGEFAPC